MLEAEIDPLIPELFWVRVLSQQQKQTSALDKARADQQELSQEPNRHTDHSDRMQKHKSASLHPGDDLTCMDYGFLGFFHLAI